MERLSPPVKKYLTGKLPTHSSTQDLYKNFKNVDENALLFVFMKNGFFDSERKPTRKAVQEGLIDSCDGKALWNLDNVQKKLMELRFSSERQVVNQEINDDSLGEPRWVNLGTIATYFNVTSNTIGKWLDSLGFRGDDKHANDKAFSYGLAKISEMNAGGKKTRKITMWNLIPVQKVLVEAGHELDFDYSKTLEGKGKNSNVEVTTIDDRAKQFAKDFSYYFKKSETRKECVRLVQKTPKPILLRAEKILKKPGFILNNEYKKYIK